MNIIEILSELPAGGSETLEVEVGLAQRIGLDGAPGRDGADGTPGRDGVDGMNGADGRDGVDGANGTNGADGVGITGVSVTDDGNLEIRLSSGESIDAGRVATDIVESNPVTTVDPLTVRKDIGINRISGGTMTNRGTSISGYIPVTPGHTYKIYLTDRSAGQLLEAYYFYRSASPSVYSRPGGSSTNVYESVFRAAENENFVVVTTRSQYSTADLAHRIAIEDITAELRSPGRIVSIDRRGTAHAILDYEKYRAENGIRLTGDCVEVETGDEKLGIIAENGGFQAETNNGIIKEFCRTLVPLPVEGYSHIRVTPKNGGRVPAYFSCYSGENFTGFLGRTDAKPWSEIGNYLDHGYIAALPAGTKYISAVTYYDAVKIDAYGSTGITAFNSGTVRLFTGGYEIPVTL